MEGVGNLICENGKWLICMAICKSNVKKKDKQILHNFPNGKNTKEIKMVKKPNKIKIPIRGEANKLENKKLKENVLKWYKINGNKIRLALMVTNMISFIFWMTVTMIVFLKKCFCFLWKKEIFFSIGKKSRIPIVPP